MFIKTLKFRVKDKHQAFLNGLAREVNFVWNYANETSLLAATRTDSKRKWLSGFDLNNLIAGYTTEGGGTLPSASCQQVCEEFATRRRQFKKLKLNWRVSNPKSSRRSLGWIPLKTGQLKIKDGSVVFARQHIKIWDSYGLDKYTPRSGSFNQDSQGHWYLNICVSIEQPQSTGATAIAIDLGLKTLATTSDGQAIEHPRYFRKAQERLAMAQRARKKRQTQKVHAKVKNQRKDYLHKASTGLVAQHGALFVGNVKPKAIAKTKMAKSSLDAGWGMFKTMLEYKCKYAGVVFAEVNEAYSTQTCSQCGSIEGPKGVAGLGIREWTCSCGAVNDRDTNAAKNILRRGLATLAEGAHHAE